MADSHILEVTIASDDHRMLSANAEAWWLVQNDVFVPFESFLTDESRRVFQHRLEKGDSSWFLVSFAKEPSAAYLTRIEADASVPESGAMLRVVMARLAPLMDDYLRQNNTLLSCSAMLSFQEDLYYEYTPAENRVRLFNTRHTHFTRESLTLEEFRSLLQEQCGPEAEAPLETWMNHLRKGTSRFRLSVPANLIHREDGGIRSVLVRGLSVHFSGGQAAAVGCVHPVRDRSEENREIVYDGLTGAVSRDHILRMAEDRINRLKAQGTAVAILDIDYFKHVNDNFGHQHGDDILRQVVSLTREEIRSSGVVGRIGGDEFLLLFYHVSGETELRAYLRSIKSMIAASLEHITVSIGAAIYPDDAGDFSDVFMVADYCLYLAKDKGRNRYVIHNFAKHPPAEEIRKIRSVGDRSLVKGRDDLPLGEALVQMRYLFRCGKPPSLPDLLGEFAVRANIPLLTLWREDNRSLLAAGGIEKNTADALARFLAGHTLRELWIPRYEEDGMCVVNTVDKPEEGYPEVRAALTACGVGSYIYIPLQDADGIPVGLVFAVVNRKIFWNQQQYIHYRLFADLVSLCRVTAPVSG